MASERPTVGMYDTSVVIDLERLSPEDLPLGAVVSTITLAELAAGIEITDDPIERQVRIRRHQRAVLTWKTIPFDVDAAQNFGILWALSTAAGRNPRPRSMDLLIGATAMARDVPLYTRNPKDFKGLERALTVVAV